MEGEWREERGLREGRMGGKVVCRVCTVRVGGLCGRMGKRSQGKAGKAVNVDFVGL